MCPYEDNFNKPITFGKKYTQVTSWNIRDLGISDEEVIRYSKNGKNSILNDEILKNINKDALQALYKYFDGNKDTYLIMKSL